MADWYPFAREMCLNYDETHWYTGVAQSDFYVAGLHTQTALLVLINHLPAQRLRGFCLLGFCLLGFCLFFFATSA